MPTDHSAGWAVSGEAGVGVGGVAMCSCHGLMSGAFFV